MMQIYHLYAILVDQMHYGINISNLKTNFKFGIYFIFIGIYLASICKFFGIYLVSNRYQIDFRYLVATLIPSVVTSCAK